MLAPGTFHTESLPGDQPGNGRTDTESLVFGAPVVNEANDHEAADQKSCAPSDQLSIGDVPSADEDPRASRKPPVHCANGSAGMRWSDPECAGMRLSFTIEPTSTGTRIPPA